MLINVNCQNGIELGQREVSLISFKELSLRESDIEEFIRKNIQIIFEEESLLIVGQQLVDTQNGRSDLIAVDGNGDLVLIEIKRDKEDIRNRKEPLELQAIRYAASLAKIKKPDDLVEQVYASYIEKHITDFSLEGLTPTEKGKRLIGEFLESNNSTKTFNSKQKIILISSSFDDLTLSSVSWLISNNVDMTCISLTPTKLGEDIFIEANKILPPMKLEDFYIEVKQGNGTKPRALGSNSVIKRTSLPRMQKLLEWGIISVGEILVLRNKPESEARIIDSQKVNYKGRDLTYNQWGQEVFGWSSICIYEWAMPKGGDKTLYELRAEKMSELEENEN